MTLNRPGTRDLTLRPLALAVVAGLLAGSLAAAATGGPALAATVAYRVNAGGSAVSGTPSWTADTTAAPSPYVNAAATGNTTASFTGTINLTDPSIPPGTPAALFSEERYDVAGGAEMLWTFPVTAGTPYEVRMFFAETYAPNYAVGKRIFDVSVEGTSVLDNYDIFASVGANKAVMKAYVVTPSDANLEILFGHVVENPEIMAIEIVQQTVGATLAASPSSVTFPSTLTGSAANQNVTLTNQSASGGNSITITGATIGGADAGQFTTGFVTPATLIPGGSTTLSVTFSPTSAGTKTATLSLTHSGTNTPLQIALSGTATTNSPGAVLYRVNAGGAAIAGTPNWAQDTASAPSPYSNSAATTNLTASYTGTVDMTHASIPAGTPMALLQSERYDPAGGSEMQWSFPVAPGAYTVRLYFAENYAPNNAIGARVFDVRIEGSLLLNHYDIFADVGANKAVMKSFAVTSDSTLNIDFGHVVENPEINAIEIIDGGASNTLGASPASVSFGAAVVNTPSNSSVQLTNLGNGANPSITVNGVSFSGTDASNFSSTFSGPLTLAPGASATLPVRFTPTSLGAKNATMSVSHSGINTPLAIPLSGTGVSSAPVGFGKSTLTGEASAAPTTLQYGPDGRLYVGQFDGTLNAYTIVRNGANSYAVTATETINLIKQIPNHDDNGALNASVNTRIVTGLLVTGTAANPVVYVTSSDPRIGGGSSGTDTNLDTNSSMLSRLTKSAGTWSRLDLVRGLPRSEENHSANGIALDAVTNTLYIAQGGNTNKGAPSNNFARLPEFALSAAILSVDLNAIGNSTYDLPTLDDDSRAGNPDTNDPFGGDNGKNQARLVNGGPVQVYAPGFRNPYDFLITSSGRKYTIDNGGNAGWGDVPIGEGPGGTCTNGTNEPGTTDPDGLHLVTGAGYYGGHPNPTRGNTANTFDSNGQSPVSVANAIECDFRAPGANGSLTTFPGSTNGLTEYTTNNFGGAMTGDLVAADFSDNTIYRIKLSTTGTSVVSNAPLFSTVGANPLDVTALGTNDPFPGTVWVADEGNGNIYVFEPNDYTGGGTTCTGADNASLDEDGDGFNNHDEVLNGTNPCSSADVPPDNDGDKISNLLDPDDDNDALPDTSDRFAIDASNGTTKVLPIDYTWDNGAPNPGGLLNLGFTGLMTNGTADYRTLYDPSKMTAGGAGGLLTIDQVSEGDALGATNTQQYGFQLGVNAPDSGVFTVHSALLAPFAGITPTGDQSAGVYLGAGDQDNYVKLVVTAGNGTTGLKATKEVGGVVTDGAITPTTLPGPGAVDLYLTVDAGAGTVQPWFTTNTNGVDSPPANVGSPIPIPTAWLTSTASGLAVGVISTSAGPAPPFAATWDFMKVVAGDARPAPAFVEQGGQVVIEGEHYHAKFARSGHDWVLGTSPTGFAGTGFVQALPNNGTTITGNIAASSPELDYRVQFSTTGTYYVWIRGRTDSGADNSLHAGRDGVALSTSDNLNISKTNAWLWSKTTLDKAPATITVTTPGVHTLNLWMREDGFRVDRVIVTTSASYTPTGTGPAESPLSSVGNNAGQWSTRAAVPTARAELAVAEAGGKVYVIGGSAAGSLINTVSVYDPGSDTWAAAAALPGPARDHVGAATVGGKVYAIGGLTGWPSPSVSLVYMYDPGTNTWTQKASLPVARGAAGVAVIGTKIYVLGGLIGGVAVNSSLVYDTSADTWSSIPAMPTARDHLVAEAIGGRIYAIGGRNQTIDSVTATNEYFDTQTGTWSTAAPMPTARGGAGSGVLNGRIYVFGGEGNTSTSSGVFDKVEEFDAATNTWRTMTPMATPRHGTDGAVVGLTIYVPGGSTAEGSHPTSTHDAFHL